MRKLGSWNPVLIDKRAKEAYVYKKISFSAKNYGLALKKAQQSMKMGGYGKNQVDVVQKGRPYLKL